MRIRFIVLLLVAPLLFGGCAAYSNMKRQENCDKMIKDYSRMIRWNEAEKIAGVFVVPTQRPAFDKTAESIRRRGVSMVDYRILAKQCMAEKKKAEATVEFDYFILPDNRLKTITDHQTWIFLEENPLEPDAGEGWKITSPLPEFK
jgi:hypothetical protein